MIKPWADRMMDGEVKGATVAMCAEITELRAALVKAELHIKHIGNDALRTENAQLRIELAALKNQEPVGNLTMDGEFIQNQRYVMEFGKVPRCKPLYLAPGARPVKAG